MLKTFRKSLTVLFLASSMLLMSGYTSAPMAAVSGATDDIPTETGAVDAAASAAPLLYCRAGRGTARFGKEWFDFSDASFRLHSGERVNVSFFRVRSGEKMTVQALFDNGGQKLIFCPVLDGPENQRILCASMYALEDDLQTGLKRTLDIPNAVRGGAITCAYDEANLKSLAMPGSGGD